MGKGGRRKLNIKALCLAFCLLFLLCGCGGGGVSSPNLTPVQTSSPPKENAEPTYVMLVPEASGVHVKENDKAIIDYSNFEDGYVMVKFKEDTGKRVKAQIKCSADTYTFDVKPGQWEVLPFGNGNDSYTVQLCENIEGNKYAVSSRRYLNQQLLAAQQAADNAGVAQNAPAEEILMRGKSWVPRWAMMFLMPLCPPAEPVGRMRSFPTGRDTSS